MIEWSRARIDIVFDIGQRVAVAHVAAVAVTSVVAVAVAAGTADVAAAVPIGCCWLGGEGVAGGILWRWWWCE